MDIERVLNLIRIVKKYLSQYKRLRQVGQPEFDPNQKDYEWVSKIIILLDEIEVILGGVETGKDIYDNVFDED